MLQEKKVLDVQHCLSQCGKKVWKSLFWRKGALEKFRALLAAFSAASQLKRNTWKAIQIWQRLLFQIWQWLIRALMTNDGNVSRPGLRGRGWSCFTIWTEILCLPLIKTSLCTGCPAKWTGWRGLWCCGRRTPTSSPWASRSLTRWGQNMLTIHLAEKSRTYTKQNTNKHSRCSN